MSELVAMGFTQTTPFFFLIIVAKKKESKHKDCIKHVQGQKVCIFTILK